MHEEIPKLLMSNSIVVVSGYAIRRRVSRNVVQWGSGRYCGSRPATGGRPGRLWSPSCLGGGARTRRGSCCCLVECTRTGRAGSKWNDSGRTRGPFSLGFFGSCRTPDEVAVWFVPRSHPRSPSAYQASHVCLRTGPTVRFQAGISTPATGLGG